MTPMRIAAASAAAGALMASLLTLLAGFGFPWELISHFHPHLAAGAGLCAAVAASARAWAAGAVLALLSLVHTGVVAVSLWPPAPGFTARAVAQAAGAADLGAVELRMVWANLHLSHPALERTAALATAEDAALVALTELPDGGRVRLADLFAGYCLIERPGVSRLRVVLLTRGACGPSDPALKTALDAMRWPHAVGALHVPAALTGGIDTGAQLIALHPPPPMTPGRQAARDTIIRDAVALANPDAPAILLGDFNATPWSPILRTLRAEGWLPADCGAPWRSTWLSRHIFLGLPIDMAYVRGVAAIGCTVGPHVGSDHYPLVVRVRLAARG